MTTCLCCGGVGTNNIYSLDEQSCHVCQGAGKLSIQQIGTDEKWIFAEEPDSPIFIHEFEDCPALAEDVFEWIKETEKGNDWWVVHSKYPILEALEYILIEEGIIFAEDIPGGPSNPYTDKHKQDALKWSSEQNGDKEMGKSYRQGLRERIEQEMREKLQATNNTTHSGEPEMTKQNVVDKLKAGGHSIADAAKEGVKIGSVTAANAMAVELLINKMGDACPPVLRTPGGKALLEVLLPSMVLMITALDEQNRIPGKSKIEAAATLAVTGSSSDAVQTLIQFLTSNGGSILAAYMEAGTQLQGSNQLGETMDFTELSERLNAGIREAEVVGADRHL